MRKKFLQKVLKILIILAITPFFTRGVYAGSDNLDAGKRIIFEDNKTESMRDVYIKKEAETKEYREKILSNSEESVKLLKEIRDLLAKLYELDLKDESY